MISISDGAWSRLLSKLLKCRTFRQDFFFLLTAAGRCLREVDWYVDVLNCGQLGLVSGAGAKRRKELRRLHRAHHEVEGAHSSAVFDRLLVDCNACR